MIFLSASTDLNCMLNKNAECQISKIKISKSVEMSAKYTPIPQIQIIVTFFCYFCCWNDVISSMIVFTKSSLQPNYQQEYTHSLCRLYTHILSVEQFHHFIKTFQTKFSRLKLTVFWSFKILRIHFIKQFIKDNKPK